MNGTTCFVRKVGFVLGAALLGMLTGQATHATVSVEVGVVIHAESDFYEPLTPILLPLKNPVEFGSPSREKGLDET